jgi:hypothetical protein
MRPGDPRFATFPAAPGAAQLRWYILQTASGALDIQDLLADLRPLHEHLEQQGPVQFASADEGRAVWDVLWAVEFFRESAPQEEHPEDWYTAEQVLEIVKRAATHLAE